MSCRSFVKLSSRLTDRIRTMRLLMLVGLRRKDGSFPLHSLGCRQASRHRTEAVPSGIRVRHGEIRWGSCTGVTHVCAPVSHGDSGDFSIQTNVLTDWVALSSLNQTISPVTSPKIEIETEPVREIPGLACVCIRHRGTAPARQS